MTKLIPSMILGSSLVLAMACGKDDKKSATSSETVVGLSTYTNSSSTGSNEYHLPSEMRLVGKNAGCAFSVPSTFLVAPGVDQGISISYAKDDAGDEPQTILENVDMLLVPNSAQSPEGEALAGSYSLSLKDGAVARNVVFKFSAKALEVSLTCAYASLEVNGNAAGGSTNNTGGKSVELPKHMR